MTGMASQEPMTHATSASGVTTDSQPVDAGSNPKKRKRDDPEKTLQELLDERNKLIWVIFHQEGHSPIVRRIERMVHQFTEVHDEFMTRYPDPCQPVPYTDGLIPEMRGISALRTKLLKHIRDTFPQYDTITLEENQAQLEKLQQTISQMQQRSTVKCKTARK